MACQMGRIRLRRCDQMTKRKFCDSLSTCINLSIFFQCFKQVGILQTVSMINSTSSQICREEIILLLQSARFIRVRPWRGSKPLGFINLIPTVQLGPNTIDCEL